MDTNSFRGISVSSCFSKLFCKILFDRLDKYLDDNSIVGSEQTGFRKLCRTTEHILTLKTFIDKAFKSSSRLYTCFVDLSKVSKGANIRNRYNQVPHLTQDTNGKVTNLQSDTTKESQEVSPFPAGYHKAHINRRA